MGRAYIMRVFSKAGIGFNTAAAGMCHIMTYHYLLMAFLGGWYSSIISSCAQNLKAHFTLSLSLCIFTKTWMAYMAYWFLKCVYRASMRKKFTTGMCLLIVQYCLEIVQLCNQSIPYRINSVRNLWQWILPCNGPWKVALLRVLHFELVQWPRRGPKQGYLKALVPRNRPYSARQFVVWSNPFQLVKVNLAPNTFGKVILCKSFQSSTVLRYFKSWRNNSILDNSFWKRYLTQLWGFKMIRLLCRCKHKGKEMIYMHIIMQKWSLAEQPSSVNIKGIPF